MAGERGEWIKGCGESVACVEVLLGFENVLITSSDSPDIIRFTHAEWAEFVKGVKEGRFDL